MPTTIVTDVHGQLNATLTRADVPTIDNTEKVHGKHPKVQDFGKYSKEELQILLLELKKHVKRRIEVTSRMGRDRGHGQRQGAEQDLINHWKISK